MVKPFQTKGAKGRSVQSRSVEICATHEGVVAKICSRKAPLREKNIEHFLKSPQVLCEGYLTQ